MLSPAYFSLNYHTLLSESTLIESQAYFFAVYYVSTLCVIHYLFKAEDINKEYRLLEHPKRGKKKRTERTGEDDEVDDEYQKLSPGIVFIFFSLKGKIFILQPDRILIFHPSLQRPIKNVKIEENFTLDG